VALGSIAPPPRFIATGFVAGHRPVSIRSVTVASAAPISAAVNVQWPAAWTYSMRSRSPAPAASAAVSRGLELDTGDSGSPVVVM
jgi:hypothetical protein